MSRQMKKIAVPGRTACSSVKRLAVCLLCRFSRSFSGSYSFGTVSHAGKHLLFRLSDFEQFSRDKNLRRGWNEIKPLLIVYYIKIIQTKGAYGGPTKRKDRRNSRFFSLAPLIRRGGIFPAVSFLDDFFPERKDTRFSIFSFFGKTWRFHIFLFLSLKNMGLPVFWGT